VSPFFYFNYPRQINGASNTTTTAQITVSGAPTLNYWAPEVIVGTVQAWARRLQTTAT
jgi:hypothetical protein